MQLFVIARANKDRLNRWINDITAQYLPYEYETGKIGQLQIGVRPVQLLEIAFPEKHLEEVMKIIRPQRNHKGKLIYFLRKVLGLEDYDKELKDQLFYRIPNNDVAVTFVGIKKDAYINGVEQI
jgi:hypothetical protein